MHFWADFSGCCWQFGQEDDFSDSWAVDGLRGGRWEGRQSHFSFYSPSGDNYNGLFYNKKTASNKATLITFEHRWISLSVIVLISRYFAAIGVIADSFVIFGKLNRSHTLKRDL